MSHYNDVRLKSVIGHVTPAAKLAGLELVIFAERDRKLAEARRRSLRARETERPSTDRAHGRLIHPHSPARSIVAQRILRNWSSGE